MMKAEFSPSPPHPNHTRGVPVARRLLSPLPQAPEAPTVRSLRAQLVLPPHRVGSRPVPVHRPCSRAASGKPLSGGVGQGRGAGQGRGGHFMVGGGGWMHAG